jgi:hypothetical protein
MPKIPHLREIRTFSILSRFTTARKAKHPIDRDESSWSDRGRFEGGIRGGAVVGRSARGEDVEKDMEAIEFAGGLVGGTDPGRPGAGAGPDPVVPPGADPAAAGAVSDGGSGLRALPTAVFRLLPNLLAGVSAGLGLPESGGAGCGGGVREAEARSLAGAAATAGHGTGGRRRPCGAAGPRSGAGVTAAAVSLRAGHPAGSEPRRTGGWWHAASSRADQPTGPAGSPDPDRQGARAR